MRKQQSSPGDSSRTLEKESGRGTRQQGHRLSSRLMGNTALVFLSALSLLSVGDYVSQWTISAEGSMLGLLGYFLNFMLTTVLPLLVIFSLFLGLYSRPLDSAFTAGLRGEALPPELRAKVLSRLFGLPRFLLLLNLLSFLAGTLLFASEQGLFSDPGSPRLWYQLSFTLSSAAVYAFVQTSLNNQTLAPLSAMLGIHHVDNQGRKPLGLGRKTLLLGTLLALFTVSYLMPKLSHAQEQEYAYARSLELIIAQGQGGQQAMQDLLDASPARYRQQWESAAANPQEAAVTAAAALSLMRRAFLLSLGIVLSISAVVALVYSRELTLQIRMQQEVIKGILQGERALTERISITSEDEVGLLSDYINRFMDTLEDILSRVFRSARGVAESNRIMDEAIADASGAMEEMLSAVEQISVSAAEQARSATQVDSSLSGMQADISTIARDIDDQSSFVEQTAGAMSEMAANITSVSGSTQQADALAGRLSNDAGNGELQVEATNQAIAALQESSEKVTDIVKMLGDIAEQTNLLAMNAAIEAAHAGESGRGFAVVASEIRKLAENSAAQSREIHQHIKTMASRVDAGVEQTRLAGDSFRNISRGVRDTTQLINGITAAMIEQKSGTDEILAAVSSVVSSTQRVKQLTGTLNEQSRTIQSAMTALVENSTHIKEATVEQSLSNGELSRLLLRLRERSRENLEIVETLEELVKRFRLEEDRNE